jgi:hypothetical protein
VLRQVQSDLLPRNAPVERLADVHLLETGSGGRW